MKKPVEYIRIKNIDQYVETLDFAKKGAKTWTPLKQIRTKTAAYLQANCAQKHCMDELICYMYVTDLHQIDVKTATRLLQVRIKSALSKFVEMGFIEFISQNDLPRREERRIEEKRGEEEASPLPPPTKSDGEKSDAAAAAFQKVEILPGEDSKTPSPVVHALVSRTSVHPPGPPSVFLENIVREWNSVCVEPFEKARGFGYSPEQELLKVCQRNRDLEHWKKVFATAMAAKGLLKMARENKIIRRMDWVMKRDEEILRGDYDEEFKHEREQNQRPTPSSLSKLR